MGYNGLFMGCARQYWIDILKDLKTEFGDNPFMWSSVYARCPAITKSNLTRLKSSEWIEMYGKKKKTGMWRLAPGALQLLNRIEAEQRHQATMVRKQGRQMKRYVVKKKTR